MALELDIWTVEKLSGYFGGRPDVANISLREAIDKYTAEKLADTLEYAKANSPFYKKKLESIEAFSKDIPFTTAEELAGNEKDFLCGNEDGVITVATAGTKGSPKKLYFTAEDNSQNASYFSNALKLVADGMDTVMLLVASSDKGSLGWLLAEGFRNIGARVIEYGTPGKKETEKILKRALEEGVTTIAGTATQLVALARTAMKKAEAGEEELYLRSVVLVGEFVPDQTAFLLEDVFQGMVFEHYGMTEMGLGCGLACGYSRGYHIRETDLFIELINPMTGEVVPETEGKNTPGFSNYGEIVFTTLTRKGMPLIRYRTGDFSRWVLGDCPCGSSLKRLDKIVPGDGRVEEQMKREKK